MRFHVTVIRPSGHVHASAFTEMAELISAGLTARGHVVTTDEICWESVAVNILFGAHHLLNPRGWRQVLPARSILYNLEPLVPNAPRGHQGLRRRICSVPGVGLCPSECAVSEATWVAGGLVYPAGRVCTAMDAERSFDLTGC